MILGNGCELDQHRLPVPVPPHEMLAPLKAVYELAVAVDHVLPFSGVSRAAVRAAAL